MRTSPYTVLVALCVACTSEIPVQNNAPTSLVLPPPDRAIHLRTIFDVDPGVYVGRFIPEGANADALDETNAVVTRCSKFIRPRRVRADQAVDERIYAGKGVGMSAGLPALLGIDATSSMTSVVRVRYHLAERMQADIDADGLSRCCRVEPSQCTSRIIGEFVSGSGEILRTTESARNLSGSVVGPSAQQLGGNVTDNRSSNLLTKFDNVYFAFLTTATPVSIAAGSSSLLPADCTWCERLPESIDGVYFCGISTDAESLDAARALSIANAREQALASLGRANPMRETTRDSSGNVALAGFKDERWCPPERIPTPDGIRYRSKVLMFLPHAR